MEEARQRVSDMLAVATVLEAEVGPEEIRRAALVPVSEAAERFVVMLAACARENLEAIARVPPYTTSQIGQDSRRAGENSRVR